MKFCCGKLNLIKRNKKTLLWLCLFSVLFYSFKNTVSENTAQGQIGLFASLYKSLHADYAETINSSGLIQTALNAMTEALDPYTEFIPEEEIEDFKFDFLSSEYGGIGAFLMKRDSRIYIAQVVEGSPAQREGLRAGDRVISINGTVFSEIENQEDIVGIALRGQPDTPVQMLIERGTDKELFSKTILRKTITFPNVSYSGTVDKHHRIGFIKLDQFLSGAALEVRNAYLHLKKKDKIQALIVDLRDNGGGLLHEAVAIVNYFTQQGSLVAMEQSRGDIETAVYHYALAQPIDTSIPIVVLINENSASAAEITAGAFQDLDRAVIAGQTSYGKGSMQQVLDMPYGTALKVTFAKYYTPSGRCIQKGNYGNKDVRKTDAQSDTVSAFYTKNRRIVYSGGGITPDVLVAQPALPSIVEALDSAFVFFDYASLYAEQHHKIPPPSHFALSGQEYEQFLVFLQQSGFQYELQSNKVLERFKQTVQPERYDLIANNLNRLEQEIQKHAARDLATYKNEISAALQKEIVSRYYYDRGQIEHSLQSDSVLLRSVSILNNPVLYRQILNGEGVYKQIN